jgi:hypothetical protein
MGGHGGLNITMQKSYAPYSWKNRQRVERDERELVEAQEALALREAAALSTKRLEAMRGAGAARPPAGAPAQHVNLFAEEESALRNEEAEREARERDRTQLNRLMPDLRLGRSATEPTPWYLERPRARAKPPPGHGGPAAVQAAAPPLPSAPLSAPAAAVTALAPRGRGRASASSSSSSSSSSSESRGKRGRSRRKAKSAKRSKRRRERHHERSPSASPDRNRASSRKKRRRSADDAGGRSAARPTGVAAHGLPADELDALRRERLRREIGEQERVRKLLAERGPRAPGDGQL